MSRFLNKLMVQEVSDTADEGRGLWELKAPLSYQSDIAGKVIVVPVGFRTDFASVPRVPIAFLLCGDTASAPAALHDFLYTAPHDQIKDRSMADAIFREAALAEGVPAWRCWMLWSGVRIGGASHWD